MWSINYFVIELGDLSDSETQKKIIFALTAFYTINELNLRLRYNSSFNVIKIY